MKKPNIGYALCGSYCTLAQSIEAMRDLAAKGYDIRPIMSENTYSTDTRFGRAEDFQREIETLCGRNILHSIAQVEPIGPKGCLDVLVVAPCTGNTLSKLAAGITDTAVTMAMKAQLRNQKPVVLALATNDALSGSAKSLGTVLAMRNVFLVPLAQDDPHQKPASMVADFTRIEDTILAAMEGRQIQPVIFN